MSDLTGKSNYLENSTIFLSWPHVKEIVFSVFQLYEKVALFLTNLGK